MNKETLARAKELEKDIRDIRNAMTESGTARHFAMLEHYGLDARQRHLPKWLTPKIMKVLGEERERLEHELENLTDDNIESTDFKPTGKYNTAQPEEASEQDKPKKKRSEILSMFYATLLSLSYIALAVGINLLTNKLFGWRCGIESVTFTAVFTVIWVWCYAHVRED
jgi:hypothetical protein